MAKSLSKEEKFKENERQHYMNELKVSNERLEMAIESHPEIRNFVQTLLLIGGDTVEFEGWVYPQDLERFARIGKSVSRDEVSTAMARNEEREAGLCFANTAEFLNKDLRPAFAFALADRDGFYSYWIEHFILKHVPTGTYHESTDTDLTKWYFIVDITYKQFEEMGTRPPASLSW